MTTDATLLQADQQARVDALDINRSFIVQAPAGSGKTELLIQRYLRLLATVESPEEVLAITFTRKAAAEMRLRVLEALEGAQRGEHPEQEHLKRTANAAAAVLQRDKKRAWRLIENSQRLRIQTLDALNASIARMQPLTQSTGGNASVVAQDSELDALYDAASMATLDWLGESGDDSGAIQTVLQHLDYNTQRYVGYLSRMLRTRDQWLPFVKSGLRTSDEIQALRAAFEASLARIISVRLSELQDALPGELAAEFLALGAYAGRNLLDEGLANNPICALADQPVPPVDKGDSASGLDERRAWWLGIAELLLVKAGNVRKQINKNQGFPPGDDGQKDAMKALLADLNNHEHFIELLHIVRSLPPATYSDEQWAVLVALFRLLPVAVAELRRIYLAKGTTDYIEIAISADKSLGRPDDPGDAALLMDYQVRHILVDEMQDTSRAQYQMLETLTGGWESSDGRTLFVVGDPMQSIYRFRNAEVAQFLLARKHGIGSVNLEPLVLRRNFRSGSLLVDWFNKAFPTVMATADDIFNGAVAYSEAVSVDSLAGQGVCKIYPVFGTAVDLEAAEGCRVIAETLASTTDETIAVLVRSRTQLPALLRRLREANIAYQAVDIDRLSDLPEIIEVLALARALSHPGDRVAWLSLLRAPWVGLDWTDIHALVYDAPRATIPELLADAGRLDELSDYGRAAVARFNELIEPFLAPDRSVSLQQKVEKAWFVLGGPALMKDQNAVSNVYHFFDALSKFEAGGTISDPAALIDRLDQERVASSVSSRVQVMTMHKAKGLQFDHVVLYGLGRYPSSNKKAVLSWLDLPESHDSEEKIVSPVGREDDLDNDPLHKFIERAQKAKDDFEKARLLYVACTRARKSLHLLGNVRVNDDGTEYKKPFKNSLLNLLWPIIEPAYEHAFKKAQISNVDDDVKTLVKPPLRRFRTAWKLPDLPAVPGTADPDVAAESLPVNYEWVGIEARLAGTVTHRILQQISQGLMDVPETGLQEIRPVLERWLTELGATDDQRNPIRRRVEQAIAGILADDKGRWLLQGEGEAEFALSGIDDGRVQSIVIDRVRFEADGTHWIIDYKTSSHEGGDLEGFLRAERERYREQLTRYAAMYRAYSGAEVRSALYFPLLQEFVEVKV